MLPARTAFKTKKELDDYFAMLEEAKKRDHRKLGRELELFVFDDDVGPGLPMFLPRGAVIAEELEKLAKETEFAAGYQRVRTPHIARESLYKKSGHIPYYVDSLFPPIEMFDNPRDQVIYYEGQQRMARAAKTWFRQIFPDWSLVRNKLSGDQVRDEFRNRLAALPDDKRGEAIEILCDFGYASVLKGGLLEPNIYYLKAMNCPHHHKLFAAVPRSYRDLPLRLAEYGTCYRQEQAGELFGLMRARFRIPSFITTLALDAPGAFKVTRTTCPIASRP